MNILGGVDLAEATGLLFEDVVCLSDVCVVATNAISREKSCF